MTDTALSSHSGLVAIVGRPNVGKSTLMNRLVGVKLSITSRKPQTTRHRILGILTRKRHQFVFVDTPGFQTRHNNALNRLMNRSVTTALSDVDVVIVVVEAGRLTPEEKEFLKLLPPEQPVLLAVNKIDRMTDKAQLLPFISEAAAAFPFAEIVPISAEKGSGVEDLLATTEKYLPEGEHAYDAEEFTDRSERFLAAEILREKLFRNLGEELPYGMAVEIEKFEQEGNLRRIFAAVVVDKDAHKAMVIGAGGQRLKRISTDARGDMERLFGGKVYLETWVKVKSGWADDERALKTLGYE